MNQQDPTHVKDNPSWHFYCLMIAGFYNLVWGGIAIFFPQQTFAFFGMDQPRYPQFWQCIGMIVGVYGLGYVVAAGNSARHWPIILVGFLGKIFGPLGFAEAVFTGKLPIAFGLNIITNDLIWWVPFYLMLKHAYQVNFKPSAVGYDPHNVIGQMLDETTGKSIQAISFEKPILLVFLRHAGCTFCREALFELAKMQKPLNQHNTQVAVVHMSQGSISGSGNDFSPISISDPDCRFYRSFGLPMANLSQVFGLQVCLKGVLSFLKGHGLGPLQGNGFQLSGYFMVEKGRVEKLYLPADASDVPSASVLLQLIKTKA